MLSHMREAGELVWITLNYYAVTIISPKARSLYLTAWATACHPFCHRSHFGGIFSGNQRYGVGAILVFFVVGGLILMGVDEEAGVPASGRTG